MVRPVSPQRRFNTTNPRTPTAVGDVATGLQLRVATYSGRHGEVVDHHDVAGVRLGRHTLDGRYLEVDYDVHGSHFVLEVAKPAATTLVARVRLTYSAELALRLWTLLIVEADPAAGRVGDVVLEAAPVRPALPGTAPLVLRARAGAEHLAVVVDPEPSVCGGYPDAEQVTDELEHDGYFPPARTEPDTPGAVVARFVHEATDVVRVAAALALDPQAAEQAARAALGEVDDTIARLAPDDAPAAPSAAIRDVLGWNTLYDPDNHRVYTGLSRRWASRRFGGWLLWQSDVLYNALLAASLGDGELAVANLDAVCNAAQPAGNLPCLLSGRTAWGDRAHPPLAAWMIASVAARLGDTSLASRYLDTLLAAHRWWEHARHVDDVLLGYGSSPTGAGLYARTALAGRNESSMDNSPMFDDVGFDADRGVLDLAEVGLNALHVLDAQALAGLATQAGRAEEAGALVARARERAEAVRTRLWDAERATFAGRRGDGSFVRSITPTSLLPLLAGIATDEQVAAMLTQVTDPAGFGGAPVIPAHRLDDPAVDDDRYWRGRSWPPLHWLTYQALHRVGARDLAARIAADGHALFAEHWSERRHAFEHYHVRADGPHLGPDVDTFYSWSALLPFTAACEVGDLTPWDGLRLGPQAGELIAHGRRVTVTPRDGGLAVQDGVTELLVRGVALLTHVVLPAGRARVRVLALRLPPGGEPVELAVRGTEVLAARVDDAALQASVDDGWVVVRLPAASHPRRVEVVLT